MSLAVRPALCVLLAALVAAGAMAQSEAAPEAETLVWDQVPLAEALYAFTEASGVEIVFALRLVRDWRVSGSYTVGEPPGPVLADLLRDTGLRAERVRSTQYVLISDPLNLPGLEDDPSLYIGVLEGRVTDAETDEPLWGAHVWLVDLDLGGVVDARGEFLVERLPAGTYSVRVSHIGYRTVRVDLDVFPASPQIPPTIRLRPEAIRSTSATVRPSSLPPEPEPGLAVLTPPGSPEAGRPALSIAGPVLGGDLLGGLSLVPGVSRASGASGPLTLRGADPGRALVLRDGVPIYGEGASFQPEALQSARLHNGPLPVELDGGAGILELTTRAPGADARGVLAGGLGGLRGVVAAPLAPGIGVQAGWGRPAPSDLPLASARALGSAFVIDPRGRGGAAEAESRAWDAEAKVTWTPKPAQTVEAGVYRSGTRLGADLGAASWHLRTASTAANVRYEGLVDDRTFATGVAYVTHASGAEAMNGLDTRTGLIEGGLRAEFDHALSLSHQIRIGAHLATREVVADQGARLRQGLTEAALYVRDTWKPGASVELRPGARLALIGTRVVVEPRLQARWSAVPQRLDLRAGLARQTQAVHRLHGIASGAGRGSGPRDLAATRWLLASGPIAPATTWLGGLGAEWRPSDHVALSADLFVRTARDVRLARGLSMREPPVASDVLSGMFPAHRERAIGLDLAAGLRRDGWALQGGLSVSRAEVRPEAPRPAQGARGLWRASRYSRPISVSLAGEKTLGLAILGARLDLESARPGFDGTRAAPEARLTLGADAETRALGVTWILGARAETRLRGEGALADIPLASGAPLALGSLGPAVVPGVRLVARW